MDTIQLQAQLNLLKKRVFFLWVSSITLLFILVLIFACAQNRFDTITARKINLVDEKGRPRLVIGAPVPDTVMVQGQKFPRSTKVYGTQFLDSLGNEVGGIGIEDRIPARMLCFDYETAEAMCITKFKDDIEISMFNKPASDAQVGQTGVQRVAMGVSNAEKLAFLILLDNNGKERIKLFVDSSNVAQIQILDEKGSLVYKIPQK